MPHALIVIRDDDSRNHLAEVARAQTFSVSKASNAEAGLTQMESRFPNVLFLDRCFGGRSRKALLDQISSSGEGVSIMVGSSNGRIQSGNARREPTLSFRSSLGEPLEAERVRSILEGVASTFCEIPDRTAEWPSPEGARFGHLEGSSPPMRKLYHLISRAAPSRASVLVSGESGSGKERVARTIHDLSPRRRGAFVAVNCGAISPNLMESQIFGHEKGSFSGASSRHRGYFEQADGGTLLLDEITEMPPELQVKLLRVLESGTVIRVGAETSTDVDVRVLATTNRPPLRAVAEGKLRKDLYYRVRILEVAVPPLRTRLEDLPHLAEAILDEIGELEGDRKSIGPEVMEMLQAYDWPGNVRELRNALYTAFLLSEGPELEAASIVNELSGPPDGDLESDAHSIRISVGTSIREMERKLILTTLAFMDEKKDRTAEVLGVSLKTLYNRLHDYGYMG